MSSRSKRRLWRGLLWRGLLWSLPLALVLFLSAEIRRVQHRGLLSQVGSLAVDGQWDAARQILADGFGGSTDDPQFAALNSVLEAAQGQLPKGEVAFDEISSAESEAVPLPLIVRAAFERGEFIEASHLASLSDSLGQPKVAALQVALAIESGQMFAAPVPALMQAPVESRLLERLEGYVQQTEVMTGQVVRDRMGKPIATFDGRRLRLRPGVRPEWVPRAIESVLDEHRGIGSLRSSLDLELSEAAYRAFGRSTRGSIVLLDPRSGEVLAAVSDRRTHRQGGTPAFEQFREPASIAKLVTASAVRRAGRDPDAELEGMVCRGHELYDGQRLYCPHIAGRLRDLDRAMAVSCNVAFATLGTRLGRQAMLDELKAFGFGRPWGPFPGARILQARGDQRQLADLSIGLEATEITPLHGAMMAAVMANDGVMPRPRLLISEDGRLGLHPRPIGRVSGRRVIDAAWLPQLVSSMEAVVERGTARRIETSKFPVAMKTGTASHLQHGFHVNYIGIGPMPEARLAFCVRITDQRTSRKVRAAARDVTSRLLRNLGRIAERRGWFDESTNYPYAVASADEDRLLDRPTRPRASEDELIGRR